MSSITQSSRVQAAGNMSAPALLNRISSAPATAAATGANAVSKITAEAAVMAAEAEAEAADEASRVQFEVPHDKDAETSDIDIVLDGMASYDADMDSITFSWAQTEGPEVALSEEVPGRSTFKASPGKYTFELTVTDIYGESSSQEARVSVQSEPNVAPSVEVSVYTQPHSNE